MASVKHRKAMKVLLKSAKYSDLSIICGGYEFPVHRAIVCLRCPFFDAACGGEFEESNSRRIDLKDDDPDTVRRMISFLYTLDYDHEQYGELESVEIGVFDSQNNPTKEQGEARGEAQGEAQDAFVADESQQAAEISQKNGVYDECAGKSTPFSSVRVYAIADKYNVPKLKELAKQKFCKWAETNWACPDFPALIREIFESTPNSDRGLRDLVLQIVAEHADVFIANEEFLSLVESIGHLGLGIFRHIWSAHLELQASLELKVDALERQAENLNQLLVTQNEFLDKSNQWERDTKKMKDAAKRLETAFAKFAISTI